MKTRRPPISPEAKENQMIALAMDLVEQRLLDGTASSSETVHFLKMGSMEHQREMEKLEEENKLLRAKTEALESSKEVKELYENALKAMRNYAGPGDPDEYEDY
jgi:ribosomal protein S2